MEAYLTVSFVLFVIWLVLVVLALIVWVAEGIDYKFDMDALRVGGAVAAVALLVVLFHIFIIALAVPVIFFWGSWQAVKFAREYLRERAGQ